MRLASGPWRRGSTAQVLFPVTSSMANLLVAGTVESQKVGLVSATWAADLRRCTASLSRPRRGKAVRHSMTQGFGMRRAGGVLAAASLLAVGLPVGLAAAPAHAVSTDLVISQVYGGGGNSGAPYTNDFVELFNRGAAPGRPGRYVGPVRERHRHRQLRRHRHPAGGPEWHRRAGPAAPREPRQRGVCRLAVAHGRHVRVDQHVGLRRQGRPGAGHRDPGLQRKQHAV